MAEERDNEENTTEDGGYSRDARKLPPGESPSDGISAEASMDQEIEETGEFTDAWLIQKAQSIYSASTDYMDANITNVWERSLSHFRNEHAPGTAYNRKGFKRSRTFRPKTRANVKQHESGLANAAFSTLHLVDIQPRIPTNPAQQLSAAINKICLQYRLENSIKWFLTVQGAFQDTKVYGLCISHQYWDYLEDTDLQPAKDEKGELIMGEHEGDKVPMGEEVTVIRRDKPAVDLIEPENFRFDAMCDWRDPASTSPYIILLKPMYVGEALEMMESANFKTGQPRWRKYSRAELLATRNQEYSRTRQAREGRGRIDPADDQAGDDYTTVWAHMNIVRVNGTDYIYWTMGTELVLTDPIPLTEEYPWLLEGERPFVVGYSTIETHRNFPAGDVEQSAPIQEEINTVANQRLDNVKLVLNKRYFVKRGSQVDLESLIRNVPGGGVMMNDPEKDVITINTPDVTGSSYQEQGVLASEFDELVGGFNPQTAQQKSVGGMTMAGAAANSVQDYGIKVFIETWMQPVLRQLVRLEQMYETDFVLLAHAAEEAEMVERFGLSEVTDDLLRQELTVRVNVGMGNTDPMRRVERLVFGVAKTAELNPQMQMRLKGSEVADEIFGSLGYRDSSRFFMSDDEFAQWQEQNPPGPSDIDVKMRELDIRQEDNKLRDQREREKAGRDFEVRMEDILARQDAKLDELMTRLAQAKIADQTQRDIAAGNQALQARDQNVRLTESQAQAQQPPKPGGEK